MVMIKGLGKVGYVANSPRTVLGDSCSAGRLYDKIGDTAKAKVKLITDRGILCTLKVKTDGEPVPPEGEESSPEQEEPADGQPGE